MSDRIVVDRSTGQRYLDRSNRDVIVRDVNGRSNLDRLIVFNRDDFSDVPLDYRHSFLSILPPRKYAQYE